MKSQVVGGNKGVDQPYCARRIEIVKKTGVERQCHKAVRIVENQAVCQSARYGKYFTITVSITDTGHKLVVTQQQPSF